MEPDGPRHRGSADGLDGLADVVVDEQVGVVRGVGRGRRILDHDVTTEGEVGDLQWAGSPAGGRDDRPLADDDNRRCGILRRPDAQPREPGLDRLGERERLLHGDRRELSRQRGRERLAVDRELEVEGPQLITRDAAAALRVQRDAGDRHRVVAGEVDGQLGRQDRRVALPARPDRRQLVEELGFLRCRALVGRDRGGSERRPRDVETAEQLGGERFVG